MTAADLDEARDLVLRGSDIGARIEALDAAVDAARGRLDDAALADALGVADRGAARLRLSAQHTVVAIAGATGSGKSSTFNALTGLELSSTGVRRPTTSWATACVWGSAGASEVLEWLGIPPRHQTMRDSLLDLDHDAAYRADRELDGVVLMDLPDHDSTEVAHHLEVDRLVLLADLIVWVLDPQKYADAAIHDRYLAPFTTHASVMVVVLNHIDTVPQDRRQAMVDDVKRLLTLDGLAAVPVFAISAREGIGVDELRTEIARRVAEKRLTRERVESDLRQSAERIAAEHGDADLANPTAVSLDARRVEEFEARLAEAAAVPVVADAVETVVRSRMRRMVAWPPAGLLLRRGRRDRGGIGARLQTPRAQVTAEVREFAADATAGLGRPWVDAVDDVAEAAIDPICAGLDAAVAAVDPQRTGVPGWARAVGVVQWLLLLAAIGCGVWAGLLGSRGELRESTIFDLPVAIAAAVGAVVLGLVLWIVAGALASTGARRRRAQVMAAVGDAVESAAREHVVAPVRAELAAHAEVSRSLAAALA
ncbi:GTPase [Nocardioides sp. R-C-SC26]|uniref:GTPase n=1 Tax=Nocardioides sp. R-C-SC26 TaxID=2870414 RepID=UPI001E38A501|nr:GTPase [Nocardioides sp. R-C-SC26]